MTEDQYEDIVRRYREEFVGEGNLEMADALLSEEFLLNGEKVDRESHKHTISLWKVGFPDLNFTIEELIVRNDRVLERWVARGTHRGDFFGISATGEEVEVMGMLLHRIKDDKITEIWEVMDMVGLLGQLGVMLSIGGSEEKGA